MILLEVVFVAPRLFNSMVEKDWASFNELVLLGLVIVGAIALLGAGTTWMQNVLSLYWYRAMVEDAHAMYFDNRTA